MTWWAAQVASEKEYETKREIIGHGKLKEEDIYIPRKNVFTMINSEVEKKSEPMLPGYLLLNLGDGGILLGIDSLSSYIKILGRVSETEMENVIHQEAPPSEDIEAEEGDRIIVTRGPFAGLEGSIVNTIGTNHFNCKLTFQGQDIELNLNGGIIEVIQ